MDEAPPRRLKEQTERHRCVKCLREVDKDEYLENDFLCDNCAEQEEKDEGRGQKAEG
jgi:hypothetical protein